jgi:hypothetical protein
LTHRTYIIPDIHINLWTFKQRTHNLRVPHTCCNV